MQESTPASLGIVPKKQKPKQITFRDQKIDMALCSHEADLVSIPSILYGTLSPTRSDS